MYSFIITDSQVYVMLANVQCRLLWREEENVTDARKPRFNKETLSPEGNFAGSVYL
jgi:hypothetical protein